MPATVFFAPHFHNETIALLCKKAMESLAQPLCAGDQVALKVHFGEKGNTRFVSPKLIQPIAQTLQAINQNLFITDANTLYRGMRYNATNHLKIAREHGFESLGLPIVIADGEHGEEEIIITIDGRIFKEVRIARAIAQAQAMVAVSHFKGHVMFGFGGAIKNLGMGSGSRAGKLAMHSKIKPSVGKGCVKCGQCVENCLANAISIKGDCAYIDQNLCTGCARCIAVCAFGAISVPWGGASSRDVMARTAEYALGTVKNKKIICITFINNITKDCDCLHDTRIIGEDVGIVAGTDPVACDQAAYDLVLKANNGEDIFLAANHISGSYQIEYGAEIGLGSREYTLEIID